MLTGTRSNAFRSPPDAPEPDRTHFDCLLTRQSPIERFSIISWPARARSSVVRSTLRPARSPTNALRPPACLPVTGRATFLDTLVPFEFPDVHASSRQQSIHPHHQWRRDSQCLHHWPDQDTSHRLRPGAQGVGEEDACGGGEAGGGHWRTMITALKNESDTVPRRRLAQPRFIKAAFGLFATIVLVAGCNVDTSAADDLRASAVTDQSAPADASVSADIFEDDAGEPCQPCDRKDLNCHWEDRTNPSNEIFTSTCAGDTNWISLEWIATVPPETFVWVFARSGFSLPPDASWSHWSPKAYSTSPVVCDIDLPQRGRNLEVRIFRESRNPPFAPSVSLLSVSYRCL